MSTKAQRKRAALLYAGALLHNDDGETAGYFTDELKALGDRFLKRAKWQYDGVPMWDDIIVALGLDPGEESNPITVPLSMLTDGV